MSEHEAGLPHHDSDLPARPTPREVSQPRQPPVVEQRPIESVEPELLRSLGGQSAVLSMLVRQEGFAGPLPPPGHLRDYEKVCPGLADQIVKMAHEEAAHRRSMEKEEAKHKREMEKEVLRRGDRRSILGLIAGLLATVVFCALAAYSFKTDHANIGGFLATVDVVALVSVFVLGRHIATKRRAGGAQPDNQPNEGDGEQPDAHPPPPEPAADRG